MSGHYENPKPSVIAPVMSARVLIAFSLLALFWGGSFVAIKEVVTHVAPSVGALLRLGFGVIALGLILRWRKIELDASRGLKASLFLLGILQMGLPFFLIYWGEQRISAGLAGLLNSSVPIWATIYIFSMRSSDEKSFLSLKAILGVSLGFAGVFVIFSPFFDQIDHLYGALMVVIASNCYAIGGIISRRLMLRSNDEQASIELNLCYQQYGALFFLSLVSVFSFRGQALPWEWPISVWAASIYLGVFSTAVALLLYFYCLKEMGSVRASAVTYVVPVISFVLDYFIYGNTPSQAQLIGAGFIFASLALLNFKNFRKNNKLKTGFASDALSTKSSDPHPPAEKECSTAVPR